jgi:hypothetical protein
MSQHKEEYRSRPVEECLGVDFAVVEGPKHLPDPGIPVFIRLNEDHPFHNKIAVLRPNKKEFALATFSQNIPKYVAVPAVTSWDYCVPAGDML